MASRGLALVLAASPEQVLSPVDQHELAVLASKFRNLHVWGCWWYCNNPSLVTTVTRLRLELLGPNFTFQARRLPRPSSALPPPVEALGRC